MRKTVGILFIVIGLGTISYFGYDWVIQRRAIQNMNQEQLNEYLKYDKTYIETVKLKTDGEKDNFNKGDKIGELHIPGLKKKYPVFFGTDDETLKSGVGMHDSQWTVLPNQTGHVLLAGHRDTVFKEMGDLKIGDILSVKFKEKTYVYQVRKIFVTDKEDRTVVVKKEKAMLTISTCYPFQFIGDAAYRYIIQSELIDIK